MVGELDDVATGTSCFGKSIRTGLFDSPRCRANGDVRNGRDLRDWPPRMEIGEEMKRKVQERWREYGFV